MLSALACNAGQPVGTLVDYHLGKPWNESAWISAKDAQVVTGEVKDTFSFGEQTLEASPAVYDGYLVVGTRDCEIRGFKLL